MTGQYLPVEVITRIYFIYYEKTISADLDVLTVFAQFDAADSKSAIRKIIIKFHTILMEPLSRNKRIVTVVQQPEGIKVFYMMAVKLTFLKKKEVYLKI